MGRISNWLGGKSRSQRCREREDLKEKLVVMGIAKNEPLNIEEWIQHYLWQGADRIVLIDNGSTDDTVEKARALAAKGLPVDVVMRPEPHQQLKHYKSTYRQLRLERRFKWLLIADLDEFWFCPNGDRLADALDEFNGIQLIYANWNHFGDGGRDTHPKSLRTELCMKRPELVTHFYTKWIARTSALWGGRNIKVHRVVRVSSKWVVSDNARFQLNHYVTQSKEFFFGVKATRGDVFRAKTEFARDQAFYDKANLGCTVEDTALADQVNGKTRPEQDRTGLASPMPIP